MDGAFCSGAPPPGVAAACSPTAGTRYFSGLTGESTALARSSGRSRGLTMPWADRGTTGEGEAARPVMTPDEVRRMDGKVLLIAQDRRPMLLRQRPWYRVRALARLVPTLAGDALGPLQRRQALVDPGMAPAPIVARPPAVEATVTRLVNSISSVATLDRRAGRPTADAASPGSTGGSRQEAPGPAGAPPAAVTPAAPADTPDQAGVAAPADAVADGAGAAGSVRLSDAQRTVLAALAATGRPGGAVSSTELAERTGLNRDGVRGALKDLRDQLGIDQAADIVRVARERGLLGGEAPGA